MSSISFSSSEFARPGVVACAMDLDDDGRGLIGYREKWRKLSSTAASSGSHEEVQDDDELVGESTNPPDLFSADKLTAFMSKPGTCDKEVSDATLQRMLDNAGLSSDHFGRCDDSEYEPSVAAVRNSSHVNLDVGGRSSPVDDCAAVSHHYIRGIAHSGIVMLWETDL